MATTDSIYLSKSAQQGVVQFNKSCLNMFLSQWSLRTLMERIDLDYMREGNFGDDDYQARVANLRGDKSKIRDPVVPIIYPQVEAATAYLTGTFLTGYPIFGVAASPESEDAALQMESIISDQQIRGSWIRELMMFFRDGLKYNLHGVEVPWDRETTYELVNDAAYRGGSEAKPQRTIWAGNSIKRLDMYNTFFDTRKMPSQIAKKGEFAGYMDLVSRIELKMYINALPDEGKILANIAPAFASGPGGAPYDWYYIPKLNPDALIDIDPRASTNWLLWAGLQDNTNANGMQYQNMYTLTTLYGRIIPSDFGIRVPSSNTPQVWKFVIVNNDQLIYFERLTNAHNLLPILIGQPLEDGLGYQTKSFATNVKPYQDISTALWAGKMNAERRRVMDRMFYDPSRIRVSDINSSNPIARVPVKSSAYNKNVAEAVHIAPFQDQNSQFFVQTAQLVTEMAQLTNGMNRPIEGQFQKGNKTQTEFQTIMGNANARLQSLALFIEAQTMIPLKEILKTNILQFQGPAEIYNIDQQKIVNIDPVALRSAAMKFKISDGTLPTDKILSTDFMGVLLQVMGSSPQLQMEYDTMGLFAYWAKTKGARDLAAFKRTPEEKQQFIANANAMNQPPQPGSPNSAKQEQQVATQGAGTGQGAGQ